MKLYGNCLPFIFSFIYVYKERHVIKYHDDNNHPGRDETISSIKNDNYYWISITTDVEGYLKHSLQNGSHSSPTLREKAI